MWKGLVVVVLVMVEGGRSAGGGEVRTQHIGFSPGTVKKWAVWPLVVLFPLSPTTPLETTIRPLEEEVEVVVVGGWMKAMYV